MSRTDGDLTFNSLPCSLITIYVMPEGTYAWIEQSGERQLVPVNEVEGLNYEPNRQNIHQKLQRHPE